MNRQTKTTEQIRLVWAKYSDKICPFTRLKHIVITWMWEIMVCL